MEKKQVKRVRNRAASVFVVKVEKVHEHVKMSVNESAFPGIIYPSVSSYSITSATTYRMPYTGERGATPIARCFRPGSSSNRGSRRRSCRTCGSRHRRRGKRRAPNRTKRGRCNGASRIPSVGVGTSRDGGHRARCILRIEPAVTLRSRWCKLGRR